MGPLEHPLGLILVQEAATHEEPEHGVPEGLAEGGVIICRPSGPATAVAVGPETVVGHDEMEMPVGQRSTELCHAA